MGLVEFDLSSETMSSTRSANSPIGLVAIWTIITMWTGVACVSPWPNRQRKSMMGTMTPRKLSTPRT